MPKEDDFYSTMTNRELLAACMETMAAEAWEEFVRRFEPIIAGSVARIAKQFRRYSSDLILDLTQEVYLKLCRDGFKLLRDLRLTYDKGLFSYLKLVAMSVTHDHFRKNQPDINADEFCDESSDRVIEQATIGSSGDQQILLREITEIVNRITAGANQERDRLVFWLHHREGFTASAIASIPALKLGQKGVESILHRTKIALRAELRRIRKHNQFRRRVKTDFSVS